MFEMLVYLYRIRREAVLRRQSWVSKIQENSKGTGKATLKTDLTGMQNLREEEEGINDQVGYYGNEYIKKAEE